MGRGWTRYRTARFVVQQGMQGLFSALMTVALDLPSTILTRLEARAAERQMSLVEYLTRLIEEALPAEPNARAVSLLEQWEAEDATDDPEEVQARRDDWNAMKEALNESHGSDRRLFP